MHILFDASRLLRRTHLRTPTGIDRVDLAYATALLEDSHAASFLVQDAPARILRGPGGHGVVRAAARIWSVPPSAGADPVFAQVRRWLLSPPEGAGRRICAGPPPQPKSLRNLWLIAARLRHAARLPLHLAGMAYLNTSHSGFENTGPAALLKQRGAGIVAFLHDLIPLDHPEFSEAGASARHAGRLRSIQRHADLVLVNSQDTGDRFRRWLDAAGLPPPPVERIALGVDPRQAGLAPMHGAPPYFVCAGTVEPRKNHGLLFEVWRQLARVAGPDAPRLVVAGRRNSEAAGLGGPGQSPLVLEAADLGDAGLASLIAGARGLLQPSFAEGFGLPVAEGQALGTPVVASDIPAHREIAGASTLLLDPRDPAAWLAAVEALAAAPPVPRHRPAAVFGSRDHVEAALRSIRAHFKAPG